MLVSLLIGLCSSSSFLVLCLSRGAKVFSHSFLLMRLIGAQEVSEARIPLILASTTCTQHLSLWLFEASRRGNYVAGGGFLVVMALVSLALGIYLGRSSPKVNCVAGR